jgi:hypothetical protein
MIGLNNFIMFFILNYKTMGDYQNKRARIIDSDQISKAKNELDLMHWKEKEDFELMLREFYFELLAGRLSIDEQYADESKNNIINGRSVRYWLLDLCEKYGALAMFEVFNPIYKATGKAPSKEWFLEKLGYGELNL